VYASHFPLSFFVECCLRQGVSFHSGRMRCSRILPFFFYYHHMLKLKP
jgi:hypothetical protein